MQHPMANELVLLGDIGATNARLGLFKDGALGPVEWMAAAEYAQFPEAVETFLVKRGRPAVTGAMLAVAGPVEANRARMTNRGWVIDGAELCAQFRLRRARILNDFEATAWSLPHLEPEDLHRIGAGSAVPDTPMAVLGPGSGLGVACYVPGAQGGIVLASEGGHADLPGSSDREDPSGSRGQLCNVPRRARHVLRIARRGDGQHRAHVWGARRRIHRRRHRATDPGIPGTIGIPRAVRRQGPDAPLSGGDPHQRDRPSRRHLRRPAGTGRAVRRVARMEQGGKREDNVLQLQTGQARWGIRCPNSVLASHWRGS